jgi:hypothetical protein
MSFVPAGIQREKFWKMGASVLDGYVKSMLRNSKFPSTLSNFLPLTSSASMGGTRLMSSKMLNAATHPSEKDLKCGVAFPSALSYHHTTQKNLPCGLISYICCKELFFLLLLLLLLLLVYSQMFPKTLPMCSFMN